MQKIKQTVTISAFAILITLVIYWKIPIKGLIPFPADLLVGRFFPFNTMEWKGYPLGVPYKEFINADVIRQLYPWRDSAMRLLKKGEMPWWNPYAFSGNPLLANIQSAAFYPLNFIYWLTSQQNAWIFQVLLQPILAIIWMWLFTKELGLSKLASAIASIAFAFSGYMVIFWQLNTVGHAALWLPLILWGIERFRKTKNNLFTLPIIFGHTASLLAGHLQTTMYVFAVTTTYFLFRVIKEREKENKVILKYFLGLVISFALASLQLLPAIRFMSSTPRGIQTDEQIFRHFILPPRHLITFFAHDFFGNPAVENFWGVDYGEFMGYFGVVALTFAVLAITSRNKQSEIKFFTGTAAVALVFALPPLAQLLRIIKIPILATSAPSRTLMIVQFCGAILAGFGLEIWLKRKANLKPAFLFVFLVYLLAWVVAGYSLWHSQDITQTINWKVTLRNLILPTATFIVTAAMLTTESMTTISKKLKSYKLKAKQLSLVVIFSIVLMEYSYFANKFQTFSEKQFFFPASPIYDFLSDRSKESPDRFFGDYTSSVTSNSWLPYEIYGVEGYDSLYILRYGELLAASEDGLLPDSVPRSDANLVKNQDDIRRRRLQDLLGVKYILDKNDNPTSDWEPEPHRFPPERYQLIWQQGKFKVYENIQSLPRAFLAGEYTIETDPQTILNLVFNPDFDLSKNVIVEESISGLSPLPKGETEGVISEQVSLSTKKSVEFLKYTPNRVELIVETPIQQMLFLSDTYYPDWIATVDGRETKIYRANYAFRAIVVSPGTHRVIFKYQPSLISLDFW